MGRRRDLEAAIVKHEVEQHGLVAVRQARALRISEGALQRRVDRERHRRIARGVLVTRTIARTARAEIVTCLCSLRPMNVFLQRVRGKGDRIESLSARHQRLSFS